MLQGSHAAVSTNIKKEPFPSCFGTSDIATSSDSPFIAIDFEQNMVAAFTISDLDYVSKADAAVIAYYNSAGVLTWIKETMYDTTVYNNFAGILNVKFSPNGKCIVISLYFGTFFNANNKGIFILIDSFSGDTISNISIVSTNNGLFKQKKDVDLILTTDNLKAFYSPIYRDYMNLLEFDFQTGVVTELSYQSTFYPIDQDNGISVLKLNKNNQVVASSIHQIYSFKSIHSISVYDIYFKQSLFFAYIEIPYVVDLFGTFVASIIGIQTFDSVDYAAVCLSVTEQADNFFVYSTELDSLSAGSQDVYILWYTNPIGYINCYDIQFRDSKDKFYILIADPVEYEVFSAFIFDNKNKIAFRQVFSPLFKSILTTRMFEGKVIYAAGITKFDQFIGSLEGAPLDHDVPFVGKVDTSSTILEMGNSTVLHKDFDIVSFDWIEIDESLLGNLQQIDLSLVLNECYTQDLLSIDFTGQLVSEEADLSSSNIEDIVFYIGDEERILKYEAFALDGVELQMTYSIEMAFIESDIPSFIQYNLTASEISINTNNPSDSDIITLKIIGTMPIGRQATVQFGITIEIPEDNNFQLQLDYAFEFAQPLSNQVVSVSELKNYNLPKLIVTGLEVPLKIVIKNMPSNFGKYQKRKTFTFFPNDQIYVGKYTIEFLVGPTGYPLRMFKDYSYKLFVLESSAGVAPYFETLPDDLIIIEVDTFFVYKLPNIIASNPTRMILKNLNSEESFIQATLIELTVNSFGKSPYQYDIQLIIYDYTYDLQSDIYNITIKLIDSKYTNSSIDSDDQNATMKALILDVTQQHMAYIYFYEPLIRLNTTDELEKLQNQTNLTVFQVLEQEVAYLDVSAKFKGYKNQLLFIDLIFEEFMPSLNGNPTFLQVDFATNDVVESIFGNHLHQSSQKLLSKVPAQLGSDKVSSILVNSGLDNAVLVIQLALIVVEFLLSKSLVYCFSLINMLQIIMHLPALSMNIPSNATAVFKAFIQLANLNFLPVDWINSKIFKFEDSSSLNIQLKDVGYDSTQIILNLQSTFYYGILIVLLYNLIELIKKVCSKKSGPVKNWIVKTFSSRFYFDFLNETFIVVVFSSFINTKSVKTTNSSYTFDIFILALSFAIIIVYPCFVVYKIRKAFLWVKLHLFQTQVIPFEQKGEQNCEFSSVDDINFVEKNPSNKKGEMDPIQNLAQPRNASNSQLFKTLKKSKITYSQVFFFLLLRIIFGIVAIYIPTCQIQLMIFVLQLYTSFVIHERPFKDSMLLKQSIFNEVMTLLITVHLFFFEDFYADAQIKYAVGWFQIVFILLTILVNNGIIVADIVYHIKRVAKRKLRKGVFSELRMEKKETFSNQFYDTQSKLKLDIRKPQFQLQIREDFEILDQDVQHR